MTPKDRKAYMARLIRWGMARVKRAESYGIDPMKHTIEELDFLSDLEMFQREPVRVGEDRL